ncbi:hypothetical protein K2Q08_03220 [Patescibacteria group bacterium]|nr:hypothetical protein [Patescibacteria group bacterium]
MMKMFFFTVAAVLAMISTAGAQQVQYTPDSTTTTTSGSITMGIGTWNPRSAPQPSIPAHQMKHYLTDVYLVTRPGANGEVRKWNCRDYHDTWFNARNQDCWPVR